MGQDSILGQILESKQMLIISTEGLEQVFYIKQVCQASCASLHRGLLAYSSRPIRTQHLPQGYTHHVAIITGPEPVCLPLGEVRQRITFSLGFCPVLTICKPPALLPAAGR